MINMHCVDAAMTYANDDRHGGNGYSMRLKLEDGEVLEGTASWARFSDTSRPRKGTSRNQVDNGEPTGPVISEETDVLMLIVTPDQDKPDLQEEMFIDKKRIVSATILW